jgi:hypothetical protein
LTNLHLHIISFDVPFPANYGGVIDVFYKLRALHTAGVKIHLHCFVYHREPAAELEKYCETVKYYPRKTGLAANLGLLPYIVAGRISEDLVKNLLNDDFPILFEGLHTCGIMQDERLKGRFLVYRESNIEHHYYRHLSKAEKNPFKKLFFLAESYRLFRFQKILRHASVMLAVSKDDTNYLASRFPEQRVIYLPSFHHDNEPNILSGKGTYALYQGKLSVPENSVAAEYLISRVWDDTLPELLIAGLDPPDWLVQLGEKHKNIKIIPNPSDQAMFELIRGAHVNIMVTFQPTGLKLKLLNALFNGRFCLVNPEMVAGTTLDDLCIIGKTPSVLKDKLKHLFTMEFTESEIVHRQEVLTHHYSNDNNCRLLIESIHSR